MAAGTDLDGERICLMPTSSLRTIGMAGLAAHIHRTALGLGRPVDDTEWK